MNTTTRTGFYLTRDLMFSSRVSSQAAASGAELRVVDSLERFCQQSLEVTPALILIDLELIADDIGSAVSRIREAAPQATLVAYVGHVKENLLDQARLADIDTVMTRGQFNQSVADVLDQSLA